MNLLFRVLTICTWCNRCKTFGDFLFGILRELITLFCKSLFESCAKWYPCPLSLKESHKRIWRSIKAVTEIIRTFNIFPSSYGSNLKNVHHSVSLTKWVKPLHHYTGHSVGWCLVGRVFNERSLEACTFSWPSSGDHQNLNGILKQHGNFTFIFILQFWHYPFPFWMFRHIS